MLSVEKPPELSSRGPKRERTFGFGPFLHRRLHSPIVCLRPFFLPRRFHSRLPSPPVVFLLHLLFSVFVEHLPLTIPPPPDLLFAFSVVREKNFLYTNNAPIVENGLFPIAHPPAFSGPMSPIIYVVSPALFSPPLATPWFFFLFFFFILVTPPFSQRHFFPPCVIGLSSPFARSPPPNSFTRIGPAPPSTPCPV